VLPLSTPPDIGFYRGWNIAFDALIADLIRAGQRCGRFFRGPRRARTHWSSETCFSQ